MKTIEKYALKSPSLASNRLIQYMCRPLPVPNLSPSLDAKYLALLIAIKGAFRSLIIRNAADKCS